jgi:TonB family protein
VSAGWIIFGFLAVGALVVGLMGWGVYRLLERVEQPRTSEELVDFVDDSVPRPAAGAEELPVDADSARRDLAGEAGRPQPPDPGTYEMSAVDTPPQLLNRDEVAAVLSRNYPPLLRDAGVEGRVWIRFRVTRTGEVDAGSVEVLESSHDAFTEAAARVTRRMRFRPASHHGTPVPVWVSLPIAFQTTGPDADGGTGST